ncbi:hypothetical protein GCM10010320_82000 [Streptomyces caelestis]|nr:hypothetical protein GCM10010320_82000 [Streptomyces caelestis]
MRHGLLTLVLTKVSEAFPQGTLAGFTPLGKARRYSEIQSGFMARSTLGYQPVSVQKDRPGATRANPLLTHPP